MTEYLSPQDASLVKERKQVVIDRELDKLYQLHGSVTTELVLDAARNPKSPLHQYFEWDDSVAAENWRKHQALQMIMASKMVVVLEKSREPPRVIHGERPEVRRLVSGFRGEGFKLRTDALKDSDSREVIVARAKSRLRGWCDSVVDIPELQTLRNKILAELSK